MAPETPIRFYFCKGLMPTSVFMKYLEQPSFIALYILWI